MTDSREKYDGQNEHWFQDLGAQLSRGIKSGSQLEHILREIIQENSQLEPPTASGTQPSSQSTAPASKSVRDEPEARSAARPRSPHARRHGPFVVDCPACLGTGKVPRPNSIVLHGCMLCWERGVVSTVVAEKWRDREDPQQRASERGEADSV